MEKHAPVWGWIFCSKSLKIYIFFLPFCFACSGQSVDASSLYAAQVGPLHTEKKNSQTSDISQVLS